MHAIGVDDILGRTANGGVGAVVDVFLVTLLLPIRWLVIRWRCWQTMAVEVILSTLGTGTDRGFQTPMHHDAS